MAERRPCSVPSRHPATTSPALDVRCSGKMGGVSPLSPLSRADPPASPFQHNSTGREVQPDTGCCQDATGACRARPRASMRHDLDLNLRISTASHGMASWSRRWRWPHTRHLALPDDAFPTSSGERVAVVGRDGISCPQPARTQAHHLHLHNHYYHIPTLGEHHAGGLMPPSRGCHKSPFIKIHPGTSAFMTGGSDHNSS